MKHSKAPFLQWKRTSQNTIGSLGISISEGQRGSASLELGSPFGDNQGNQSLGLGSAEEDACEEPDPETAAKEPTIFASEEVPPRSKRPKPKRLTNNGWN